MTVLVKETRHLATIDDSLRFLLFGLQCKLGVEFSGRECERIFSDAEEDQVSAKSYKLHEGRSLSVVGQVEEYEPESIWLVVSGQSVDLADIAERARNEAYRMRRASE